MLVMTHLIKHDSDSQEFLARDSKYLFHLSSPPTIIYVS